MNTAYAGLIIYRYALRKLKWSGDERVEVTAIYSPYEFWCRMMDNTFEFYQDQLQASYKEHGEVMTPVKKGECQLEACLMNFS